MSLLVREAEGGNDLGGLRRRSPPSNALPSLVILLIKSISRYYRDNEYLEALMI